MTFETAGKCVQTTQPHQPGSPCGCHRLCHDSWTDSWPRVRRPHVRKSIEAARDVDAWGLVIGVPARAEMDPTFRVISGFVSSRYWFNSAAIWLAGFVMRNFCVVSKGIRCDLWGKLNSMGLEMKCFCFQEMEMVFKSVWFTNANFYEWKNAFLIYKINLEYNVPVHKKLCWCSLYVKSIFSCTTLNT